ncbi:MAG: NAD-dependent epimerase/dehydratase family protein [Gammaproteobacteria bacterium]|nr:MAG: NAD-dependent epimerase/dehydratase family protein [Gammaproteobacteria bacterium]
MPTALITGITGFTGRYLSAVLEKQGYKVVGLTQGQHDPDNGWFCCDLLDRSGLADLVAQLQPDVVAHLAAISFVAHGNAEDIYRTNVVGTRNLLEALTICGKTPRAVLLASSANIYGNATDDPITESTLPGPANDYAVSKLAMEYMAKLWMDKLPITIARPFNYTGRVQAPNFLIPKIVDHYRRGDKEIELGNLDVARDFSDVRTVVCAYAKLIELAPANEVFNVCSGEAVSLERVLDMMASISGYSIKVRVNPAFVRESEVKSLRGSNAKLLETIGELANIPLEQTLRWMFEAGVE